MSTAATTPRGNELGEQSDYRQMLYELRSWVDDAPQMAAHLRRIREEKLFRHGGYKTFDAFCKAELGHNRDWAYKVIAAGESQECIQLDTKPANKHQAAELAKADPEERAEIWEAVVEESEATGEKITAKKVAEKVAEKVGPISGVYGPIDEPEDEPEDEPDPEGDCDGKSIVVGGTRLPSVREVIRAERERAMRLLEKLVLATESLGVGRKCSEPLRKIREEISRA